MASTEPVRDKKHLRQMVKYWKKRENPRNQALIVLAACTALRISDLLKLTWENVYDEAREKFRSHIILTERKTGKQKKIALHSKVLNILHLCLSKRRGDFIFANNRKEEKAICRQHAFRIISDTAKAVGLPAPVSAHSLRKSFGYFAWKSGISPTVLMDIYNHSSYEITRRYLGVQQDDRDAVYLNLALF